MNVGRVSAIWRYPVKSMAGEKLDSCNVTLRGLLGDRAYALVDKQTGMVVSAKNPRLWPDIFMLSAAFLHSPSVDGNLATIRISMPDGRIVTNDTASSELSTLFGRQVELTSVPPARPILQQFWPDDGRVTDERMPANSFFDLAIVNLLMTTTLDRLAVSYAGGNFDVRRFRPNIVVTPEPGMTSDPESAAVEKVLAIGDEVRIKVDSRCGRCVMTTLEQPDLPKDAAILRTIVRANEGFAGLNTHVVQTGTIRVGDVVRYV